MDRHALRETLRNRLLTSGASAVGFASVERPDEVSLERLRQWLACGFNAGMDYMERNMQLRENPALLLEGARTVISLAFSYVPSKRRDQGLPAFSCHAYGRDYHKVIRKRLKGICREMEEEFGCATRICVDSAPVMERYWASRAGIGIIGDNHCLIVEGKGSMVFLAEILTTLNVEPDEPTDRGCLHCEACVRACPTGALSTEGIDARRCLSYLTIEHRGEFPAGTDTENTLYGCDRCQTACPYNRDATPTEIGEFAPTERVLTLTAEECAGMDDEAFAATFQGSAVVRAGAEGLRRNARQILKDQNNSE